MYVLNHNSSSFVLSQECMHARIKSPRVWNIILIMNFWKPTVLRQDKRLGTWGRAKTSKSSEESQRVQKTNLDRLHVQHSLRATVSQEDRDGRHFQTPTFRRAKRNDNTSTTRQSPSRSSRTPPLTKTTHEETQKGPVWPSRIFGHPAKNSEDRWFSEAPCARFFAISWAPWHRMRSRGRRENSPLMSCSRLLALPARVSVCLSMQGELFKIRWIVICDAVWHWNVLLA